MFAVCLLIAVSTPGITGINLLLNKPSLQSTGPWVNRKAKYANDGDSSTYCMTNTGLSYWQGDLQGYYFVRSVAVISVVGYLKYLKNAFIGASVHNVSTNPAGEVIKCGQWPDENYNGRLVFNCNPPVLARYVKVWLEYENYLIVGEVEAQGMPTNSLTGMTMKSMESQKVSTSTKSLHVDTSTECSNACFMKQPCIAFSFNKNADPNCLLATNTTMTSDSNWVTYEVEATSSCP